MTKTKKLLFALIIAGFGCFLFSTSAQAGTKYEYVIKLLFDNPFTVCCDTSPAQCIADKGPVTPNTVTNYYPNPVDLFTATEYDILIELKDDTQANTYEGKVTLCLKNNNCSLGVCPVETKQPPTDKTCTLQNACADPPASFCAPEIIASNGWNVCVLKFGATHDCLYSFQCQSGECSKYGYKCAASCTSQESNSCGTKQYCEGGACKDKIAEGQSCYSNISCLSEFCYFGLCDEPAYCNSDADCQSNYYCRKTKTPYLCKEKKYSWEDCETNNECLSGACKFKKCIVIEDQCKQDYNCQNDQYCDISSTPKKCIDKKAADGKCNADKQCLSGKCESNKCTAANKCANDKGCAETEYCGATTAGTLICNAKKADKADCTANNQCASGYCIGSQCGNVTCTTDASCVKDDLYCNTSLPKPVCEPKKLSGEQCKDKSQCLSDDCSFGKCVKAACTYNSTDPSLSTGCSANQQCTASGTCTEKSTYCTINTDCWPEGYCDTTEAIHSCKPLKSADAACQSNGECQSNNCSYDGKCTKTDGGCYVDKDCPADKKCNTASHLCEDAAPQECDILGGIIKTKCLPDEYCKLATCVKKGGTGAVCEIGGHCLSNFCHPEQKKCQDKPNCGNFGTVAYLEYEEECEIGYDPGTKTAYTDKNCISCKIIPGLVSGCLKDVDCGDGYYCDTGATPIACKEKIPLSASCTTDNQCKSDYCDQTNVNNKVCAQKPGAPGAGAAPSGPVPCKDKGPKCDPAFFCNNKNLCQPKKLANEQCTTNEECAYNLCVTETGTKKVCGCEVDGACNSGEYCDKTTSPSLCKKISEAVGKGCSSTVPCPPQTYCDPTSTPNTCALKKKPGETCTAATGATECLSGICIAKGQTNICGCISHNECTTGFFCNNEDVKSEGGASDLCVEKYNAEQDCSDGEDFVCKSGKCENGKCTAPTAEQAAAGQIKSIELPNFLGETDFAVVVGRVIEFIIGLVGAAALGMFLYGGTLWLISRGEAEMLKKGRDTMVWALIGLAMVFTSFILVNFVLKIIGSTAAQ